MKKTHKVSRDVREQIINRIKNDGVSVADAAKEHGITERAIYNWLTKGISGHPTILQYAKLKKENKALKEMLGELVLEKSRAQKND